MTQRWDYGDIVLQRQIEISDSENLDSLIAKTLLLVRELSMKLLSDFDRVWLERMPMTGIGSYWRKPTEADRTIRLDGSVREIQRFHRAFGQFTLYFDNERKDCRQVGELSAWEAQHSYVPGTLVTFSPPRQLYAVRDGFVCISPQG